MNMDEKLQSTLNKIIQLTEQNPEFGAELRKKLGMTSSANSAYNRNTSIQDDVTAIRRALEIRANNSISYDFINQQRLRDQLIIDNLRMENAALNLQISEAERFYSFCVNAFYQVENIINYFYHKSYPNIKDLVETIVSATKNDGNGKYAYKPTDKEETVGDIAIASKLNAFCNTFFPDDKIKISLSNLRQVRNEGEHRCMVIISSQEKENSLYKFFKYNSINDVRIYLIKLVNEVKKLMEEQKQGIFPVASVISTMPAIETIEGTITTMLPSGCFIAFKGGTHNLPSKLLKKAKDLQVGDKITVTLNGKEIVDIKTI